jgi:hypothetical protein
MTAAAIFLCKRLSGRFGIFTGVNDKNYQGQYQTTKNYLPLHLALYSGVAN